MPRVHCSAHGELPQDIADELRRGLAVGNLRRATRVVRGASAAAKQRGLDWQTVIDALRALSKQLGHVIVGAQIQRTNDVGFGTARARHDDGRARMAPHCHARRELIRAERLPHHVGVQVRDQDP
jgi:uncharacterized NAD(P)/FAD-binding protein YdhS